MRLFFALLFPAVLAAAGISYTINTIAGSDWIGDNGPATSAILLQADGIAVDQAGNIYISDAANHRVRKVTGGGTITTVAGNGVPGFSGDGGPASTAQLNSPYGLAFDGLGNLYIADLGNARVRRIGADGNITTVAGGGAVSAGGVNEGSVATTVFLSAPRNVAWDGAASLYISDFTGQRVYRMAQSGSLTTVAGTGIAGFSGDGGPSFSAQVAYPAGLAVDREGSVYIADSANHVIRKIAGGVISSIARGATPTGLTVDATGVLYAADPVAGELLEVSANGSAAAFTIAVNDLAAGIDGYLYAASGTTALRISLPASAVVIAGGGNLAHGDGGPASSARLNHPAGVAADAQGNIYIADRDNHRIRRVAPDGTITTVAGTGAAGNTGDGGAATQALLNSPESVTVDPYGDLYIADTGNHRVREVTASGVIFPVIATGLISPVYALADAHGNAYISDAGSGAIVKVSSSAITTTVVSGLASPRGMALDSGGNLFFTEAAGARVRRLGADGALTSLAPGVWNSPRGIALGAAGDIFVADTGLNQILHVDSSGNASVIAGTGAPGFSGDGGDSVAATLGSPWDVAAGASGAFFIADLDNNRIRELTPGAPIVEVPVVTAVNAASLQPGPLAPGMLLYLAGSGLGAADLPNTQVLFNSISTPVLSIGSSGLLVEAPPQIAGQSTVQIQIVSSGNPLAQITAAVVDAAPALFADASGQAMANNQDGTINSSANPAARGSVVAFYGTGQGVADLPVSAAIGGYSADVLYAGPVAGYPGLFQINVSIPAGYLAPGDLSVVVSVGSASSQPGVLIAVN